MALDRNFVSETDTFISDLLKKRPEIKTKQHQLRNTWWDRDFVDNAEQESYKKSAAPKHGYAYFDYSHEAKKD
jgi:hypothetical protein